MRLPIEPHGVAIALNRTPSNLPDEDRNRIMIFPCYPFRVISQRIKVGQRKRCGSIYTICTIPGFGAIR